MIHEKRSAEHAENRKRFAHLSTNRAPLSFLLSLLELARWHSALGAGLAVWVGGHLAGAVWSWGWFHPMSIATLLSMAGNAYNDAGDVAADQLNRPTRPIPRGAVTVSQARTFAFVCGGLAFLLALPLGWATLLGTLVGLMLLFLYTPFLKRIPLIGNGVVGLLVGMCIGFGGLMAGNVAAVVVPGVAIGLLFGGRELLKTLYDIKGDTATGVDTVAIRWGGRTALLLATLCFAVAVWLFTIWAGVHPFRWMVPFFTFGLVVSVLLPVWYAPRAAPMLKRSLQWSKIMGIALLTLLAFM